MQRAGLVSVIALAAALLGLGCGAEVGGPCSLADRCDDGAVCDLTNPDGPICVDANGDDDGDGIRNDRDFCHHLAGGQFDEDLDGYGDECDACPIAPPPMTPDPDGDDLDSPCDPDPSTPGDVIVAFNGFNDPVLPRGWQMSPGWVIEGGTARATATATLETLTAPLPLVTTHTAVLSSYRIDRVDAAASENEAGVLAIDRRPAGISVVSCSGSRVGATDRLVLDTDTSGAFDEFTSSLFDSAGLYRVAAKIDGAQAACALIADRETGAVQASTSGQAMTEGGLAARSATVQFSYLLVVQRP